MQDTMKAAVLEAAERMVVHEVPMPLPADGWVRVRTRAAGICGSDLHIYTGNHPWLQPGNPMEKFVLGNTYGHEIAGTVDAVGGGVERPRVGDRVAVNAIVPCYRCRLCRAGQYQICRNLEHYGFQIPGGFAEYVLVPAENAVVLPDEVSFAEGALLDVLVVGIHTVQRAKVTIADSVAVIGAGPIGLAAAAAARRAGARFITITARHESQRQLAQAIGVDFVANAGGEPSALRPDVLDGLGYDVVIEAVGYKANAMQEALQLVRPGGRIVFTGVYEEPVSLDFGVLLSKEASIIASHAFGLWNLVSEFELAVEMIGRGEFPGEAMVTHRFGLDEINAAFRLKLDQPSRAVKVQIEF